MSDWSRKGQAEHRYNRQALAPEPNRMPPAKKRIEKPWRVYTRVPTLFHSAKNQSADEWRAMYHRFATEEQARKHLRKVQRDHIRVDTGQPKYGDEFFRVVKEP